ncbi:MAG: exodeoxyribonuclease V subunit beta [Burkholderiaceae bacterium]
MSAAVTSAGAVPPLDPLRFPLRGSRLIEASAGTGKTFTIAALYLRLVLGHGRGDGQDGGGEAFGRALTPPEILVVTFTDAATKELRERIRARLAEAADVFLADPAQRGCPPGTDLLHDLRADYPPEQWPACARTLRLAAEWMDEAAVSTIHGWCNRMLREHAFDSGSLFAQTLEADQRDLLADVLRDYWRSFLAALPADEARCVSAWWRTPDDLGRSLRGLLPATEALSQAPAPEATLRDARRQAAHELASMKAPWRGDQGWAAELQKLLDAAVQAKCVNGRKLQSRYYMPWLQALRAWAEGDEREPQLLATSSAWTRLTPAGMAEAWKPGFEPPSHSALDDVATLRERLAALPDGREAVLCHAAHWVAARLAAEQTRRAQMGFNELLTQLDAALRGPNGARLAELIRQQFPVALIDEFQDTDPVQYRIFDGIYRVAADEQQTAVILIGDPKQAIYAFRGADIHTYLAARRDTAGRHATLTTNFRSTAPMVAAVNHVFMRAEQRAQGQGAFLFRRPGDNPLPFVPAQARGRSERWLVDGREPAALTCWHLGEAEAVRDGAAGAAAGPEAAMPEADASEAGISEAGIPEDRGPRAADVQRALAAACATEIVRLLNLGRIGRAGFAREDGAGGADPALTPVRPSDIAVLVNHGGEARAVRAALMARGVRSVYLSDRDSVFQSPAATELLRWLAACADPDDDRPLRAALGSAALALDWAELDRLNHDELLWEARVLQFRRYQQMWRRQGVLPMLRHLLHDFGVAQRLLAQRDERTLTDLLHLAELLQQASAQLDGEHALIRWLAEQCRDDGGENEARKLRLESDADLVKVVTVHKSKGLEYPLVFVPFACTFRPVKRGDLPVSWHDDDGRRMVSLKASPEQLARADRERLGEDLRKFYVALTRARYAAWLGVAAPAGIEDSAFGYLLGGGEPLSPSVLTQTLHRLAEDCPSISVRPAPEHGDERYEGDQAAPVAGAEPALPGPSEPWWIASYSALRPADLAATGTADEDQAGIAPDVSAAPVSAAEEIYADSRAEAAAADGAAGSGAVASGTPSAGTLHAFVRGAGAGTFLHGLLEWAGRQGFARVYADPPARADLADLIARRCNLAGLSTWTMTLRDWLSGWLATPLDLSMLVPDSRPVAPAALARVQVEMEFWFAARRVDTSALDALVCRHTLGAARRPPVSRRQLNGMLKGFIDLVFEHEGRYYVIDYKSNWLGPRDADYAPASLRDAVLSHRYELQYVLYVFALHRLLRARLPGYDYERHVGGALCMFVRGHAAPGQGLYGERPPKALIDAMDALFEGRADPRPGAYGGAAA